MLNVSLIRLLGAGHHAFFPLWNSCLSFSHWRFAVAVCSAIINIKYSAAKYLGIAASPLSIAYDKTANLDETETANKQRLDAATTEGKSCSNIYTMDIFVMTNIHCSSQASRNHAGRI